MAVSNSVTEKGFSLLLTIITDNRLCMHHTNIRNQVLVAANDGLWTPEEKSEIINSAVDTYLQKKRNKKAVGEQSDSVTEGSLNQKCIGD